MRGAEKGLEWADEANGCGSSVLMGGSTFLRTPGGGATVGSVATAGT